MPSGIIWSAFLTEEEMARHLLGTRVRADLARRDITRVFSGNKYGHDFIKFMHMAKFVLLGAYFILFRTLSHISTRAALYLESAKCSRARIAASQCFLASCLVSSKPPDS